MELAVKPFSNVHIYKKPIYTIYEFIRDMCFECEKSGGGKVTLYAGSDRVPSYNKLSQDLIKKYQSRNELLNVSFEVVEAVVRGSKMSYSATKMRQHVKDDNLAEFIKHCPFPTRQENEKYGKEMFNEIKNVFSGKSITSHNVVSTTDTYKIVQWMSKKIA
jgi:hypothetical protein